MSKCKHDWVPYDTSYKASGWEGEICTKCGKENIHDNESTIEDLKTKLAQRDEELEVLREKLRKQLEDEYYVKRQKHLDAIAHTKVTHLEEIEAHKSYLHKLQENGL